MKNTREVWKPILNNHYEVSDLGRVRRIKEITNTKKGKIIKPHTAKNGYVTVSLSVSGVKLPSKRLHGLIAGAFLGPRPDGIQVNHKNGVKTDNRLENLEYVTAKGNMEHAFKLGLQPRPSGENNPSAKLNIGKVLEIRNLFKSGIHKSEIARRINVNDSTVGRVINRKTWKHVKDREEDYAATNHRIQ